MTAALFNPLATSARVVSDKVLKDLLSELLKATEFEITELIESAMNRGSTVVEYSLFTALLDKRGATEFEALLRKRFMAAGYRCDCDATGNLTAISCPREFKIRVWW